MDRTGLRGGTRRRRVRCVALLSLLAWGVSVAGARGQVPPQTPSSTVSSPSGAPDFLLGAPRAWIGLRGSQLFPRASGDLFEFVSDQLTVDRSDFRARGVAIDLGVVLTPTVDIVAGVDIARHTAPSEYRHFVASNSQPITQQTTMKQSVVSAGVRFSPVGRGRRISRFAFIPSRFAPYVGGGAAIAFYRFDQQGQFVDYVDYSIFTDQFSSDGWTVGPYVNGGTDIQAWRRLYLSIEARYSWLHSNLDPDFSGFDGIDLAGLRVSSGISVVF